MSAYESFLSGLRSRLLQAMADADQVAFHYDQEGMKAMSLINAGKSLAFEITDRLKKCGEILGIQVLDHVIVGDGRAVSLAEC